MWLAKRGKIYTSYLFPKNHKCYARYVFWKVFKKLYKTIKESIFSNVADLFYLKNTQKALGHSKVYQGAL